MKPEKDKKTGKWLIQYRYRDWTGKLRKSMKRGFNTRREAEEWLRNFLLKQQSDFDMRFKDFADLYFKDMEARLREHTMINKHYIMDDKVLPYFGEKKMNEITPADIRKWQTELINKGYSKTYLKTINNQLSAIFNFAVRYYGLKNNPCRTAGSMGKSKAGEMSFWTKEEFNAFADCVIDKRESWLAFQILFWTGMRIGELLALEINDVNLQTRVISVTKSYQRLRGKDIITPPKTPKSIRDITIPEFLVEDIRDYLEDRYDPDPDEPLIPVTKTFLEKELQRGIKASGVKKIRLHDLRHSHASLLIELGFSPKEIADRLGHEKIETTLNTYSHLYPNKQAKIAERLDRFGREEE
jgi:integrase